MDLLRRLPGAGAKDQVARVTLALALIGPAATLASETWLDISDSSGPRIAIERAGPKQLPDGMRQLWVLYNFAQPQKDLANARSMKVLMTFDCARDQNGIKSALWYAEVDGLGKPVRSRSTDVLNMKDTVPDSNGALLQTLACGSTPR